MNIGIIGIGCRFPGADDPDSFWHLLSNGVDAIMDIPLDRWNIEEFHAEKAGQPGKMNTRSGGFLKRLDEFDPGFFGISPREAKYVDPQQRLVLEVAWEALEYAGIAPDNLAGSRTGVFVGVSNADYHRLLYKDVNQVNAYCGTGTSFSIVANRLSYFLDLHGPSLAIDTACSSSLVALHYACQSLKSGESDLCIVGGVNAILTPELHVTFSQAGMMAADGRCKTFDAAADGYVRSEGCGMVILKRLPDANRDRDTILAVIKGSAVNQDGLSNGITAPNGLAQQEVIRRALENANVSPNQISYVEAHGTGTPLGDPVEMKSIKAVLAEQRSPNQNCWIGSVKTNIGHLEAAAGIAGLIRVVLSLQHQQIPPHLHLNQLNPYITLQNTPFQIPTELQPWVEGDEPRRAGVSAFGFGGTNCHVVLEEFTGSQVLSCSIQRPVHLFTLSAKNENALKQLARKYVDFFASHPDASLADVCYTTNQGRTHFDSRLTVVAKSNTQIHQVLNAFVKGTQSLDLVAGSASPRKAPRIAFLFTGQGSLYSGMGAQLYATQPVFRKTIADCNEIASPYLDQSLSDVMFSSREDSLLSQPIYAQPALFVIQYAIAKLWQFWGIEPTVVMGHSLGEYVAACIAGVFSLEDGLRLVIERARLIQSLPDQGGMRVIFANETTVKAAIQTHAPDLAIAAINAPRNTVIAGACLDLDKLAAILEAGGIQTRPLEVSHAFHSHLLDPMLEAFEKSASQIGYQVPCLPFVSTLTGELTSSEFIPDAAYWRKQTRETVQFMAGLNTLIDQDYDLFLEIGPKPILTNLGKSYLKGSQIAWLPSLTKGEDDWEVLFKSLSTLYSRGIDIRWENVNQNYTECKVVLPTYPFQRSSHQIQEPKKISDSVPTAAQVATSSMTKHTNPQLQDITIGLQLILAELLQIQAPQISIHSSFLELGADSIVLAEVLYRVEQQYSVKIGIHQLFEDLSTLNAVARYITNHSNSNTTVDSGTPKPAIKCGSASSVGDREKPAPSTNDENLNDSEALLEEIILQQLQVMSVQLQLLKDSKKKDHDWYALSDAQKRFAHLARSGYAGKQAGNMGCVIRIDREINPLLLRKAWNEVLVRHDCLSNIIDIDMERQKNGKILENSFQEIDLSVHSGLTIEELLADQGNCEFDLMSGPLIILSWIKGRNSDYYLSLNAHHLVGDGWSFSLLVNELFVIYQGYEQGRLPNLSTPLAYAKYVTNEPEWLSESALQYWIKRHSNTRSESLLSVIDHQIPPLVGRRLFDSIRMKSIKTRLTRTASNLGCTTFTLLFTLFQLYLRKTYGKEEFIVAVPTANRQFKQGAALVGCCVNLLPIRCQYHTDHNLERYSQTVKATLLESFAHQNFSYSQWLSIVAPNYTGDNQPVQVTFNLEPQLTASTEILKDAHFLPFPIRYVEFPLMLNLLEHEHEIYFKFDYQLRYFREPEAESFLEGFMHIVQTAVLGSEPECLNH